MNGSATIVRRELNEFKRKIRAQYPEAVFRVTPDPESPRGLFLEVYTETDDFWGVHDIVVSRLTDVLLEKGISIGVLPLPLAHLPSHVRDGKTRPAASYPRPRAAAQGRVIRERKATYQAKTKKRGKR